MRGKVAKIITGIILLSLAWGQEKVLTLEECIRLAATQNPQVLAAQEEYKAAKAKRYQAATALLPSAKLQGTYTRLDEAPYTVMNPENMPFLPPGTPPMKIEMGKDEMDKIELQIVEPVSAQIWTGLSLANTGVRQKELSLKKARTEAVLNALKAYYQFLQAKGFLKIAQVSKQQIDAHIKDLENMYAQGVVHKKDLLKAQVRQSEGELMLLQAQNAVELARKSLCMAIGLPQETQITIAESLSFEEYALPLDSVLALTKRNSLDAKLIDIGVEAARKQATLAWEGLLPSFSAIFNYDYQKPNRELENEWYDSWTAVGVIQWNVFDWGANIAKIKEAAHTKKQMEYVRKSALEGIELQARASYLSLMEKKEKLEVARKEVETAQENFKVTKDMFHGGAATNSELLDAQSDLTRAKINLNNYLADYNIAKAQLDYLTGALEQKIEKIIAETR